MIAAALVMMGSPAPASRHEVNISVSEDVAPSSKIQVNLNTTNVRAVHIAATRIDGERWFALLGHENKPRPQGGPPIKQWDVTVAKPTEKPNPHQADTYYSRQVNLPKLKPGVYLLDVTGGDKDKWAVVNVTDLAVVIKRSSKHALVWVTDFKTGRLLSNASIRYLNSKGHLLKEFSSGADGSAFAGLEAGNGIFVIRKGIDMAGIPSAQGDPDGTLVAHFQTDRPIYRTGQTISFRAILRRTLGSRYRAVTDSPCSVQLRDPKDNPLEVKTFTSNDIGTISGEFRIPSEGLTGPYSLVMTNGKDSAYQTVSVAQYRKPEFKVDVKSERPRYLSGDEIAFDLDSTYFFGAPVPQAQVHYQVRGSPLFFQDYDPITQEFYSGDGNLYAADTYRAQPFVAEDNVFTDEKGKAIIRIKTDPQLGDCTYSITCTVSDASHRQVEATGSTPVFGALIRIGLNCPLSYATLGSLLPLSIRLVDLDGKSTGGHVALSLKHNVYDPKKATWHEEQITDTSVDVPASGKYTIKIPARYEGDLKIYATVRDSTGHIARMGLSIYVAGNFEKPDKVVEEPFVDVKLDKKEYKPGDTVEAFVETNTPKRPILEVVEGGDIWNYHVISEAKRGQVWKFPAGLQLSPNAYVTVTQWVKGVTINSNAVMPVPDRSTALQVTVSADKTRYKPGDKATFSVHTEDGHGKPVSAEVALGVVDEAIYAMASDSTDDLYRLYWGLRPDAVSFVASAPQELSGGAYQRVNALAPVRQRFEDTAYWSAHLMTDASGNAQANFEMPGNLTTWRATARAITVGTSVGVGVSKVIASRPVTLRLAAPRQMVEGDRIEVIGTVDSTSPTPRDYDVRLDSTGVAILGEHTKSVHIDGRGEAKVSWTVQADAIPVGGLASFAGQVEARGDSNPDFADALRTSMPVAPNGLPHRELSAGAFEKSWKFDFNMPKNRLEPASKLNVSVRYGLTPVFANSAASILDGGRFGSVGAMNQLEMAGLYSDSNNPEDVRESLALLARNQLPEGWGWWENAPADPVLTARALSVFAYAKVHGITLFPSLVNAAREACVGFYNRTNLWEYRAFLASALAQDGDLRGPPLLDEVRDHAESISPYAWLTLARGYFAAHNREEADKIVTKLLPFVSNGADESFLPSGEGIGWAGTNVETTAELLYVLTLLREEGQVQLRLARWLADKGEDWRCDEENAAVARALHAYLRQNPEGRKLGPVSIVVNGTKLLVKQSTVDESASVEIPLSVLKDGRNTVELEKTSGGQASYVLDSTVYLPDTRETTAGIRVLRRLEVKNGGGSWVELNRTITVGEPVRCTIVIWGDNLRDAVQVTEPIPAGFEFVEDERFARGYEEVRDGAIIHYLLNNGAPQTFSYYLRSESSGVPTALPVSARYVRRPATRGNTDEVKIMVSPAK